MKRVLVTDHPWPSLDLESQIVAATGAEVVDASGDPAEIARLATGADAILTCFAKIPADVLDAARRCLTVARYGVGVDNIDVARATELGMVVSNVPDYCSDEVADHTLLLILALARRLVPHTRLLGHGGWDVTGTGTPSRLRGKVLGLVGLGTIGRALVPRALAVGLQVLTWSRTDRAVPGTEPAASLEELLAASDIVSLHVPATPQTRGMIGAAELAKMKPTAWLVNTARGSLVDTDALVSALRDRVIAAAALDVTDPEPLPPHHPLRTRDDVVLTPHVAFNSDGSLADLARTAATNVADVLTGLVPATVVNPEVLSSTALRMR
ncbi:C-terminal binding protein [Amycolatopsis thermalba]|uniref:C-terminal binding protein n=2 Tax=Amycolatopsis thermalba TaxID=944492 RepID=A0ABY4NXK3_9PSEU|nr:MULTISPECIES: C-terminal binding protein [Amycolatopsis]UQS24771.1 C-terminal binding protein [Amycolatopsis thermalba]